MMALAARPGPRGLVAPALSLDPPTARWLPRAAWPQPEPGTLSGPHWPDPDGRGLGAGAPGAAAARLPAAAAAVGPVVVGR